MPIWDVLLRLSAAVHDTGESQAIVATGLDRSKAGQHYAKRMEYTFTVVNTTVLVDCKKV